MSAPPDLDKLDAIFGMEQISKWREALTPPSEPQSWDRAPIVMKVKGVEREFFEIGALAEALGRRAVTIRSWEDKGIFPKPRYRTKPPRPSAKGKVTLGRRLYTRAQIEAVVAAAKVSKVYDPSDTHVADWAEFTRLVRTAWAVV